YSATHQFETLDFGEGGFGLLCDIFLTPSFCANVPQIPNTGTFEQRNWFNHLHITGGIFVRF
ncbi:MAG: hypothetical protein V3U28_06885, partial [Candidatus Acidoferrales bacterium]